MLVSFKSTNVGPMASVDLAFASRLNVFTGDNSLGKSFLLDLLWFGLTRHWPHELNPRLDGGYPARPTVIRDKAELAYRMRTLTARTPKPVSFLFDKVSQSWKTQRGRPLQPGLVVYALADGSFAVWDPILNYWTDSGDPGKSKESAFVLSRPELWPSDSRERSRFCKGVIEGWATWQRDKDERLFTFLKTVFEALLPDEETIKVAELESVPLADGGDQPTLEFGYGTVRLQYASSAVRRMAALSYVLVWAVSQHVDAAKNRGVNPTHSVILLFDEIEAHLHPRWQRSIVRGVRTAIPRLCEAAGLPQAKMQVFLSTHSPLVMSALEDEFASSPDGENKWFDFDMVPGTGRVTISECPFAPQGTAENWLKSQAFDLDSTYSPEVTGLVSKAEQILKDGGGMPNPASFCSLRELANNLANRLPEGDELVFRICELLEPIRPLGANSTTKHGTLTDKC